MKEASSFSFRNFFDGNFSPKGLHLLVIKDYYYLWQFFEVIVLIHPYGLKVAWMSRQARYGFGGTMVWIGCFDCWSTLWYSDYVSQLTNIAHCSFFLPHLVRIFLRRRDVRSCSRNHWSFFASFLVELWRLWGFGRGLLGSIYWWRLQRSCSCS